MISVHTRTRATATYPVDTINCDRVTDKTRTIRKHCKKIVPRLTRALCKDTRESNSSSQPCQHDYQISHIAMNLETGPKKTLIPHDRVIQASLMGKSLEREVECLSTGGWSVRVHRKQGGIRTRGKSPKRPQEGEYRKVFNRIFSKNKQYYYEVVVERGRLINGLREQVVSIKSKDCRPEGDSERVVARWQPPRVLQYSSPDSS